MRKILLIALVLAVALLAQPHESEAGRNRGGRRRGGGRRRMEVTCAKVKPEAICNNTRSAGFQVFDGCNVCTCGVNKGEMTCSIKSCPREDEPQAGQPARRVRRYCAKLERKVQKKLRRFQKRRAASASQQRWPIKCFKEHKLCRDRPGVAFFDGCNQCRCPDQPGDLAAAAQCEATNTCPEFVGSRREFKRHCRTLGARIEGGRGGGRRGRRRGGGGGRRRRQRQDSESGPSLMQRLLSRF